MTLSDVCIALERKKRDPAEVFAAYYASCDEVALAHASAHYAKGVAETWVHNPGVLKMHTWHLALIRAEQARRTV